MGLECKIENGKVRIDLDLDTLKIATEFCHEFYDAEKDEYLYEVTDVEAFAKDVVNELERELDETGTTLITQMLDKAMLNAIENGCEGINYGN